MTHYRGRVRLAIQSIGSGLAATLLAATTGLAWGQGLPTLASMAAMSVFAALTVRIPCTRAEADAAGITLHTLTGNAFYACDAIALIGVLPDQAESGPLAVYTPTARLIDGRDVQLTPAGCTGGPWPPRSAPCSTPGNATCSTPLTARPTDSRHGLRSWTTAVTEARRTRPSHVAVTPTY